MNTYPSEEVTLKDILLLVRDYFRFFLRKWYVFFIAGLIAGGWFAWDAHNTEGTYYAELRFSLNEDGGGGGGLGSVLGQFGLGGGEAGPNFFKLMELARSGAVMNELLFDSMAVGEDTVIVANHLIGLYGYHEAWEKSEQMSGFVFNGADPTTFDRRENRAMKSLQTRLRGGVEAGIDGLCEIEFDEQSGIIKMETSTTSESLSLHLAEQWYVALSTLYVRQSIAPQQSTLVIIETKVDSIRGVLNVLQTRYARLQDRRTGVVLQKSLTEMERVQRELGLNQIIYGEAVKNQEQASFLLANQTPAFGIIESPVEPISINKPGLLISLVKGGIIGGILAGIILFGIKLYLDAMNEK
jgi:hypothetical protein